eukprot:786566-Pyramimonas_sp.AAC.1
MRWRRTGGGGMRTGGLRQALIWRQFDVGLTPMCSQIVVRLAPDWRLASDLCEAGAILTSG